MKWYPRRVRRLAHPAWPIAGRKGRRPLMPLTVSARSSSLGKPLLDLNVGDACPHAQVALNVIRGWIRVVDRRKGMLELRIPQLGMHLIQHGRRQLHQLRAATHSQARWCVAAARIS